jgi:hypothetical protein
MFDDTKEEINIEEPKTVDHVVINALAEGSQVPT